MINPGIVLEFGDPTSMSTSYEAAVQREMNGMAAKAGALSAELRLARDFIDLMPHGDNCFLDPNRPDIHRCWCGKDSMLEHIDGVLAEVEEQAERSEDAP